VAFFWAQTARGLRVLLMVGLVVPLLPVVAVVLGLGVRPAAAQDSAVSYSKLRWAACTGAAAQRFSFDTATGHWTDDATGRCISVLDKTQPLPGKQFAPVVLDVCGGPDYTGAPTGQMVGDGQAWKAVPDSIVPGQPVDMQSPLQDPAGDDGRKWCINLPISDCTVKDPNGQYHCFEGYNFVTYVACGDENSQMVFKKDKTVSPRGGLFQSKCLESTPCDASSDPPCRLPSGWGVTFVIVFLVGGTLYAGGGVGWAAHTRGASPATPREAFASHPHSELWTSTAGLVTDGVRFSAAVARRHATGNKGGGSAAGGLAEPLATARGPAAPGPAAGEESG
jgi:hypothetical protein